MNAMNEMEMQENILTFVYIFNILIHLKVNAAV